MRPRLSNAQIRLLRRAAGHAVEFATRANAGMDVSYQSAVYRPRGIPGFAQTARALERAGLVHVWGWSDPGVTLTAAGEAWVREDANRAGASTMPTGFDAFDVFDEHAPPKVEEPWRAAQPLANAAPGDRVRVGKLILEVLRAWDNYNLMAQKPGARRKAFAVHDAGPVVEVREQRGSPDTTMAGPVVASAPYDQVRIERSNRAGDVWVNPQAYAPPPSAPQEYVERVVDALVRQHRVPRSEAEAIVARRSRPSVDDFYDQIRTGWGVPEDPSTAARIIAARAGVRAPEATASRTPVEPYEPPTPTPYHLAAVQEMIKLGAHPSLAEQIAEFYDMDGPRTGAHRTPKQAARWGLRMRQRYAAAERA